MTIGEALNECRAWEYSQEAFELTKGAYQLSLMGQYMENIEFALYANSIGDTFTEGYLFEARDAKGNLIESNPMKTATGELANAGKEAGGAWKEWWSKILNLLKKLLDFIISPFKALWQKTIKLASTIQFYTPIVLAICAGDFVGKTASTFGKAVAATATGQLSIADAAQAFGACVQQYANNLQDVIGPIGAIKTAITKSGDIKLSDKASTLVISKMFLGEDQDDNKAKLYNALLKVYKDSGLSENGKPGLSHKQPSDKLLTQLKRVANVRQNQNSGNIEMYILLYAALSVNSVNVVSNGQDLISMQDLCKIFTNVDKSGGKLNKYFSGGGFTKAYNAAKTRGEKNIEIPVNDQFMKEDLEQLQEIKTAVAQLISDNNSGNVPDPDKDDFKNAQANLQALGELHKMIPNLITVMNNVVTYRKNAITAINNFFTEAVAKNDKGEILK